MMVFDVSKAVVTRTVARGYLLLMSVLRRLGILPCVVLTFACGESLGPGDIAGTYVLQRVANDPLPAVLYAVNGRSVRVIAETLQFTPDLRGRLSTNREIESPGAAVEPAGWATAFTFRLISDRIEVAFPCPPNANCLPPPHLVLRQTADGVLADFAMGARTPLVYARLP